MLQISGSEIHIASKNYLTLNFTASGSKTIMADAPVAEKPVENQNDTQEPEQEVQAAPSPEKKVLCK